MELKCKCCGELLICEEGFEDGEDFCADCIDNAGHLEGILAMALDALEPMKQEQKDLP